MKLVLTVAGILLFAAPLLAETYSWEDETGTVNFTDNYASIPAKYRKKASKLGEMDGQPVDSRSTESGGKDKVAAPQKAAETGSQRQTDNGLFAGKKAEAWQQEMRPLYAEVKRLEQQLVELESLIKNPVGVSRSRTDGLPQEFKETQKLYNQALKQYNSLNDEANKVGLPAEFRK